MVFLLLVGHEIVIICILFWFFNVFLIEPADDDKPLFFEVAPLNYFTFHFLSMLSSNYSIRPVPSNFSLIMG